MTNEITKQKAGVLEHDIEFDITFTPWTIDTYGTFTGDGDDEYILESLSEETGRDIEYDDVEWDYDHKGFVQNLAEKWLELLHKNIIDDVILNIELDGKAYSPREYNFTTDNCNTIFTVDIEKLHAYVKNHDDDYAEKRIHSASGFMCFMDEDARELHYYLRAISEKEYSAWDYMNDVLDDDQSTWYNFIDYKLKKQHDKK